MALTASQLAICAAIFGAGVSTPTVYQKAVNYPAKKIAKPKQAVAAPARVKTARPSNILDCPTLPAAGVSPWVGPDFRSAPAFPPPASGAVAWTWLHGPPGGGGAISPPPPPPVSPAVPEPASWAMMLTGFAAMGIALRTRKVSA